MKAALQMDGDCLHWQAKFTPEQAVEFVQNAQTYNNFTQDGLTKLIKNINELVPKMNFGEGNPNNGKSHHSFSIGNEHSRVIYLSLSKLYLKNLPDFNWARFKSDLQTLGEIANADENNCAEDGEFSFVWRFWFD
jgi:hypothetical protein